MAMTNALAYYDTAIFMVGVKLKCLVLAWIFVEVNLTVTSKLGDQPL